MRVKEFKKVSYWTRLTLAKKTLQFAVLLLVARGFRVSRTLLASSGVSERASELARYHAHLFLFRGILVYEHCIVPILLSSFAEEVNQTFSSVCSAFSEKRDGLSQFSKARFNPSIIGRYCDFARPFSSFELLEKLLVFLPCAFCGGCLLILVVFLEILKVHFKVQVQKCKPWRVPTCVALCPRPPSRL